MIAFGIASALCFLLNAPTLSFANPLVEDAGTCQQTRHQKAELADGGSSLLQAKRQFGKTKDAVLEDPQSQAPYEEETSLSEVMQLEVELACTADWGDCSKTKCCTSSGMKCYQKDQYYAQCKSSCTPGINPSDSPQFRTPWSCKVLSGDVAPAPKPKPQPQPQPTSPTTVGGDSSLTYLSEDLGTAKTTRYWDCCKPSCAWEGKAAVKEPVRVCGKDGKTKLGANSKNICGGGGSGGPSYMCTAQSAWYDEAKKMSFGFVAGHVKGLDEKGWCCGCYELRFEDASKPRMVVQVTNTGSDLGENHFDIQVPGGGFGIFDGCTKQWGAPAMAWGKKYGGVMASGWGKAGCQKLPPDLRKSCEWQFEYLGDNPKVASHFRVRCPAEIVQASGCARDDDGIPSPLPQPKPETVEPQPNPPVPQPKPQPKPQSNKAKKEEKAEKRKEKKEKKKEKGEKRKSKNGKKGKGKKGKKGKKGGKA